KELSKLPHPNVFSAYSNRTVIAPIPTPKITVSMTESRRIFLRRAGLLPGPVGYRTLSGLKTFLAWFQSENFGFSGSCCFAAAGRCSMFLAFRIRRRLKDSGTTNIMKAINNVCATYFGVIKWSAMIMASASLLLDDTGEEQTYQNEIEDGQNILCHL